MTCCATLCILLGCIRWFQRPNPLPRPTRRSWDCAKTGLVWPGGFGPAGPGVDFCGFMIIHFPGPVASCWWCCWWLQVLNQKSCRQMLDSQSQAEAFDTSDVNFQHNLCRFCPEDMFLHSVCRSVDGPGYCGSHSSCVPSSRPDWHSELSELQMVALLGDSSPSWSSCRICFCHRCCLGTSRVGAFLSDFWSKKTGEIRWTSAGHRRFDV